MATVAAALLDLPSPQAIAAVALGYLDDALAAARRLRDVRDAEALHDLRVALRRLRVTVRAYPDLRAAISKKQRRRLRALARATNAARDAEVQIAWFRERGTRFTPAQRAALRPLRARLRARRLRERARAHELLQRDFGKLERKLRRRFTALQRATATDAPVPSFGAIAAATLARNADKLGAELARTTAESAPDELHATRIAAKRLRYVLEPVAAGVPDGRALIERLKALQDLLGGVTDAHELELQLRGAGDGAAPALGLLQQEVAGYFRRLRAAWGSRGSAFVRRFLAMPPSLRQRTAARRRSRAAR